MGSGRVTGGFGDQIINLIVIRMNTIGMTQAELAKRIGWTPKHVNRILNKHAEPSWAALDFICHILDLELMVVAL